MSGNAFRGVSAEQDGRFGNKEKKLLQSLKFPPEYKIKADLTAVNWEAMKPWIAKRLTDLLGGVEDDVLIGYVIEQVEGKKTVDPRILQVNLTGFLEKNTSLFCKELWNLLLSAASTPSGIPQQFLDEKAAELRERDAERQRVQERLATERRKQDELRREHIDSERRRRDHDGRRGRGDTYDRRRPRSPSRSRDRNDRRRRSRSRSSSYERRDRRRRGRSHSRERDLRRQRRRSSSRERHRDNRRRRRQSRSSSCSCSRSRSPPPRRDLRDLRRPSPDVEEPSRRRENKVIEAMKTAEELQVEELLREKARQAALALEGDKEEKKVVR